MLANLENGLKSTFKLKFYGEKHGIFPRTTNVNSYDAKKMMIAY